MGCATSKTDDLPAVALCRERLNFLDQTLHQRYTFAEAHVAYIQSLNSIAVSLNPFFSSTPPPPVPHRKPEPTPVPVQAFQGHQETGHLHFHSDDDSDSDGSLSDGSLHHDDSDPNPNHYNPYPGMDVKYMRKQVTPSVFYQQKPVSTESIQYGESSSSSSSSAAYYYNNNNYGPPQNNNPSSSYDYGGYGNPYGNMNYGAPGAGGGGFFGGQAPPARVAEMGWGSSKPQTQAPPPPPPPAASTSGWDFLSIFETNEGNYPAYTPSIDSREVREEEGIPDLEDEHYDFEHEVVKEVDVNKNFVDEHVGGGSSEGKRDDSKRVDDEDHNGKSKMENGMSQGRQSVSVSESTPVEYEVHVVDKKVVGVEGQQGGKGARANFRNVFEVLKEIQVQFDKASAAGGEIEKVLEVGKLRYQRKNTAYQVSSKMLRVSLPSLPSTSRDSEALLDGDEEVQLKSVNLSATLQKLYLWEKKLFEEVRAEEKMRVDHDKKLQKWKRMEEKGSEPTKIDLLRSEVRGLSTKIRIAIQIVDRISEKINKLRDEELWPLLNELIQGLSRMWKAMLECHQSQCHAIIAANGNLDAIAFPENPSDAQLEATLQFERDLINWTCKFSEWVSSQKGFVKSLNGWLFKCLLPEPEVTADGIAPFSPGRAGAPPIFVICNHWIQSLERMSETSEKEVVDSMKVFAMTVLHLRERDKGEMRHRMATNKDMERKVKSLEREDMKMQKEMQSIDKRIAISSPENLSVSENVVYQSDTSHKTSLQSGLHRIFEALDKFTADSVKTYDELIERSVEVAREHGKVL